MTGKGGNGCSGALVGSKTAIESSEPIAGLIPLLGEGNKALLRGVGRASDGQELGIILPQKRSSLLGYEVLICMVMRYQLVSIGSRHPRYFNFESLQENQPTTPLQWLSLSWNADT